jgi:hypothetical protein
VRRLTVLVLLATLFTTGLTATATSTANIKDKFISIGWGGSDGSLPWDGNWQENGDDGDEKYGNVRVVSSGHCASGNCIQISALTTILGGPIGVTRAADTNDLHDLELCFDIKATGSLLGSTLVVQVNDGGGWETVKTYNLSSQFSEHPTIDVDDYRSHDFRVRFRFTSTLLGSEVYIDNVELSGVLEEDEGTTTTTTTAPVQTTTTTTSPTTTTTKPQATTSTTDAPATTTTTRPRATTSTTDADAGPTSTTTTTTVATTSTLAPTTTFDDGSSTNSIPALAVGNSGSGGSGGGGSGIGPEGSGIRAAARGLQASFQGDLYGEVRTVTALGTVDLQADYNMAVEVIKASWAWMVLLGLVIAWAVVSGLDRRRSLRD